MMPVGLIAPARPVPTLKSIIAGLSLPTPNIVLDAGDPASYTSGNTWVDVQNANNVYVGDDGSGFGAFPSLEGGVGALSSAFAMTSISRSLFRSTGTPSYAESWHKNNGAFTVAALIYVPAWSSGQGVYLFSTCSGATSSVGLRSTLRPASAARQMVLDVVKGSGGAALSQIGDVTAYLVDSAWNFVAIAIDESVGSNGLTFHCNGQNVQANSTYSSPSASASSGPYDVSGPIAGTNGNKIKMFAGWSSRLTTTQLGDLYNRVRQDRQFDLP
ncbi:hypothetical protein [Ancylobacter polymorphus]|uniref:Uncharacterized protein n=1 Tax=Ancylobacter polymorphus TaxID=223390 RepID=A0A9E6ZZX7_9HYPH|nr:hypothetical protein [Ancylobacter polymorphus]UOK73022.1 hypothetical protein K9D25_10135 [Ancylobacter polymorphus]